MKKVAFVTHSDCSLHDTGWNHPEHQGRLPALMRAVYGDMLTLFEPLLQLEGRHASEAELRLVHTPEYLDRLRGWVAEAAEGGRPLEAEPGIVVSDASWNAARAAVGCAIMGADAVLDGQVTNAFCAVRPPGAGAGADAPGGFALLNSVAVVARYLATVRSVGRILVVEWSGCTGSRIAEILSADAAIRVLSIGPETGDSPLPAAGERQPRLPTGAGGAAFLAALDDLLASAPPASADVIILAAGFDVLGSDPLGHLALEPRDVYTATKALREWAESVCEGRVVSILEGGYDAAATGAAVVQHLRALAGLEPVA